MSSNPISDPLEEAVGAIYWGIFPQQLHKERYFYPFLYNKPRVSPQRFVKRFKQVIFEVYIKDEVVIVYAFKIALVAKEKAYFKYLHKYKIPTLYKLYYYYEKFWN